jgi:hypothetical protein
LTREEEEGRIGRRRKSNWKYCSEVGTEKRGR